MKGGKKLDSIPSENLGGWCVVQWQKSYNRDGGRGGTGVKPMADIYHFREETRFRACVNVLYQTDPNRTDIWAFQVGYSLRPEVEVRVVVREAG